MFVESPYMRNYLFTALQGSLELYDHLLEGLSDSEADLRPDSNRFTIREIMAHLADWEHIFLQRMLRMRNEDHPTIEGMDEGQRAIDANYGSTDWREQTRVYRERRETTIAFLNTLPEKQWERTALRPEIGVITIEAQALLMTLHDSYHLQQVKQWRYS